MLNWIEFESDVDLVREMIDMLAGLDEKGLTPADPEWQQEIEWVNEIKAELKERGVDPHEVAREQGWDF